MRTLDILVPKVGTPAAQVIRAGSGIVSAGEALPGGLILVYYEGNLYNMDDMLDFQSRVFQAADRLSQNYPTVARGMFPAVDFHRVGTFTYSGDWSEWSVDITDHAAVTAWCTPGIAPRA
jgi:hypothetical protein